MRRALAGAVVCAASLAGDANAQTTVRGIAFDSLHSVPLSGAFITVAGTRRSAVSDSRGAFQIDSLPAGTFTLVMQHEALDTLGIPSVSHRFSSSSVGEIVIAIPSFAAMWARGCGGTPPSDGALLFGTVSDASGSHRVRDAGVEVTWDDYVVGEGNKVSQQQRVGRARSDSAGAYTLCGVPSSMSLRVRASTDAGKSAAVDLMPGTWRVLRRDFRIVEGPDSSRHGTIVGAVTANATPLANARVGVAGLPDVRTGTDGRFVIRDVPVGTRQVEITAIGMSPTGFAVDVLAGDTTRVTRDIAKLVELPGVNVSAPTVRQRLVAQYLERKKAGLGRFRDSTDLEKYNALEQALREIPGMQIRLNKTSNGISEYWLRSAHGPCLANILLDGVRVEMAQMQWVNREDVAAFEVYSDGISVPQEIASKLRRNLTAYPCGVLVIWTKHAFQP